MEDVTLVTFQVEAPVALGETVCVCGDHAELGAFNRNAARQMHTSPATYPIWEYHVLLPRGVPRKYKYMTTGFKQFREWEPISDRVRVFVPDGEKMVVQNEYGKLSAPVLKPLAITTAPAPPAGLSLVVDESPTDIKSIGSAMSPKPLLHSRPSTPGVTPRGSTTSTTKMKRKKTPSSRRLVLVAFNLPVKLRMVQETDEEEVWFAEWDLDNVAAKTEDSIADEIQVVWIGAVTPSNVLGMDYTFDPSPKRIAGIQRCLEKMNCVPVFLDTEVYTNHYIQFSKNVLWDIFHNVLRPRNVTTEGTYEAGFVPGNIAFANAAFPLLHSTDIVWVHDYHLMLLPKQLRDRGHDGPIIFFLHVPFPTSEIFRTLPMRHELLEGMLSSSTIGFHTFNHGRHFLTACRRFLGAQSRSAAQGTLAVEHRDRRVLITISHLGVDPERLSISTSPEISQAAEKMIKELPEFPFLPSQQPVIFGALDDMQRLKGVPLKLLAFERFLSYYSRFKDGNARFVLWTIKRAGIARQHDVERSTYEVRKLIERINEVYGPVVIHREFDSQSPPTLQERVALWRIVDIYVSTAVSEGLNLMPLEYMYCRSEESPGIVILSEFSASSSVLNGAVRVNCYDIGYIARAMDETARMPIEERRARRARDVDYITAKASQWTRHVITEVLAALDDEQFTTIAPLPAYSSSGVALLHRVQCRPLKSKEVVKAFARSSRRVFFLDFGGTLVEREEENLTLKKDFLGAMGRGLSDKMRATLEKLCRDEEKNIVFMVSGDTRTVLTRVFYDLLSQGVPLGLVAHSGLCIRLPKKDFIRSVSEAAQSSSALNAKVSIMHEKQLLEELHVELMSEEEKAFLQHESFLVRSLSDHVRPPCEKPLGEITGPSPVYQQPQLMFDWMMTVDISKEWANWMREAGIFPILRKYTWTTLGTFYRTSGITTLWDYTFADPEWGLSQANYMILELEAAIANANLNVVVKHNKTTVQLLPKNVDKGSAVRRIFSLLGEIQPSWEGQPPDFCLCLGDDNSDELMFGAVHQYFTNIHSRSQRKPAMFTATVGRKPTVAAYYMRDTDAVSSLLTEIIDSSVA